MSDMEIYCQLGFGGQLLSLFLFRVALNRDRVTELASRNDETLRRNAVRLRYIHHGIPAFGRAVIIPIHPDTEILELIPRRLTVLRKHYGSCQKEQAFHVVRRGCSQIRKFQWIDILQTGRIVVHRRPQVGLGVLVIFSLQSCESCATVEHDQELQMS